MGLICPTAEALSNFTKAVKAGYITWHAFPFNGELELADESMIDFGVKMTWELDDAFGQTRKTVLSQRDVPGTTLAAIPILLRAGVKAISIGANGGVRPAAVPRVFMWHDTLSNTSIPTLYHQGGYGGIAVEDIVFVPGSPHGLALDWRGDNAGPPDSVEEVLNDWATMRSELPPGVTILASSFEEWASAALTPATLDSLPVIEQEMGDTWVHGVSADPFKTAVWRIGSGLRAQCLLEGHCQAEDPSFKNFSRLFLKNCEHTWAHDSKSYPGDYVSWDNAKLQEALLTPKFMNATASYQEQRNYGIYWALEALPPGSWLRESMNSALLSLRPGPPPNPDSQGGFTRLSLGEEQVAGRFRLTLGKDGIPGITGLTDEGSGVQWVESGGYLGVPEYVTYTSSDFQDFISDYSILEHPESVWWFEADYGRPNMSSLVPYWEHLEVFPKAEGLWGKNGSDGWEFLMSSTFPPPLHTLYGAPSVMWTRVLIPHADNTSTPTTIRLSLIAYQKTPSRVGEGLFFKSLPSPPGEWAVDKLGRWVDPYDIMVNGNSHHHGSLGGVKFTGPGGKFFTASSRECALVNVGGSVLLPFPFNATPGRGDGISFYLHKCVPVICVRHSGMFFSFHNPHHTPHLPLNSNAWSTNYPLWYPFYKPDENQVWTFNLTF